MGNDKMREEFEAAYVEGLVLRCGEGFRSSALHSLSERKPDGSYLHHTDSIAWWAWQDSREALVIELPQIVAYEAGYDSIRENQFASDSGELFDADEVFALCRRVEVLEAIEAAGLRVKP